MWFNKFHTNAHQTISLVWSMWREERSSWSWGRVRLFFLLKHQGSEGTVQQQQYADVFSTYWASTSKTSRAKQNVDVTVFHLWRLSTGRQRAPPSPVQSEVTYVGITKEQHPDTQRHVIPITPIFEDGLTDWRHRWMSISQLPSIYEVSDLYFLQCQITCKHKIKKSWRDRKSDWDTGLELCSAEFTSVFPTVMFMVQKQQLNH